MSDHNRRFPDDTSPVSERSGETVEEGVDEAADGSEHHGVLRAPEDAKTGDAPVENILGDQDMTEGQVVEPERDS